MPRRWQQVEAHHNLGLALQRQGQLDQARASLQQAVACGRTFRGAQQPGDGPPGARQLEKAVASLQQALRLRPDYAEAHNNLGNVFQKQESWRRRG